MKTLLPIAIILIFLACSTESINEESFSKILPDRTPFVMGFLEATNDTTHHYSEVVAGFVNNVDGYINPNRLRNIPDLYNPTLHTQVIKTTRLFHLSFTPDERAEVSVTGPLEHPKEQKIIYEYLGDGLYGDTNYELKIIPEGEYKLVVLFSDGRTYQKTTNIPEETNIEVPDSIGIQVDYTPYNDGSARESTPSEAYDYIYFNYPDDSFLTLLQSNSNRDREQLLLEPDEYFLFNDRSPYLRDGSLYQITTSNEKRDSLRRQWGQDLYNKSKKEVWHSKHFWMNFSFFNKDVGYIFHPMVDIYSWKGEEFEKMMNKFVENFESRNSSYLLDVSTIHKVDENGGILPLEETDAIGFFAGYFSVYRTTTLYPIRTFDLDSVLMNNRVYNPDNTNP